MKMKKLMALVLALTLVLALAAFADRRALPPRAATPQSPPKANRP